MADPVYLDNAATTPVTAEVSAVVRNCMEQDFGNPASAHHVGIRAERHVKDAARALLTAIGDDDGTSGTVYWTSGGTESDALGVLGAARARAKRGRCILYSAVEHSAVREAAKQLQSEGFSAVCVPVSKAGVASPEAFASRVTDEVVVAAVMLVNNELGTIMPVQEIVAAIRERNPNVHVHCDAVQALGKVPIDIHALGADSVAFAAHKLHGPKGVGALWLRRGARLAPLWWGGGHQEGVRSGTLNVPGIAGMGAAAALAVSALEQHSTRWTRCKAAMRDALHGAGVEFQENGDGAPRAPHVMSVAFRRVPAEPLLHVLESRGVLVSAGSACSERDRRPSPVLAAIGLGADFGVLRFSFGRQTTVEMVEGAAARVVEAVDGFR